VAALTEVLVQQLPVGLDVVGDGGADGEVAHAVARVARVDVAELVGQGLAAGLHVQEDQPFPHLPRHRRQPEEAFIEVGIFLHVGRAD